MYLYSMEKWCEYIAEIVVEVIKSHGIFKGSACTKLMVSLMSAGIAFLEWEPIEAKTVVTYVTKHFYSFRRIFYYHASLSEQADLFGECCGCLDYDRHKKKRTPDDVLNLPF